MSDFLKLAEMLEAAAKALRIADAALVGIPLPRPPRLVKTLGLSVRAETCLKYDGIQTVEQLCGKTSEDLEEIRNFGKTTLQEVRGKLLEQGLFLKDETPPTPEVSNGHVETVP